MEDRVIRNADVAAPPDRVWEALTEAGELSAWFGAEADGAFQSGGRIRFRWGDGRERLAVIEELDRSRRLAFRWLPFERHPGGETRLLGPGRVEITLESVPDGTRITVVERGSPERLPTVGSGVGP
ncbi:MAG TPA: SRPBCC domain-containing protein [Actinomycetota bacterium]|nr:SRPBCC domain-containing protein [Actinomycetota bacterium]